ncbi:toxin-antitoxin system HicB family antitoxin [Paracraurococcus lichenis]|uniref:Toxin-antitoxin system HicB family antitoxin n=1 Tax=Paracraurococcus lichenis TaxID=3064888 RepID=A0ABT9E4B6_9PROT|nr:toxin-antitoxin system HicB family antitoxin [Paracraurococcus sp. LOR1-02]MDO9711013.1 toxin-antitoxin system HicB family antitoxin [Paracraurococcus sp. LOR1-02]
MTENRRTVVSAYALRLPASVKAEAERLAAADGTSLNQFVASAVAEKIAALRTAEYFAERRARADWDAFDRIMSRPGGEPPRPGDEPP